MPDAYNFVSVPKQGNNPGMPEGKKNIVVLFNFDDVTSYARNEKSVQVTAFEMANSKTPIGLFVNEKTIDGGDAVEGDDYERGFIQHLNFQHPGTELAVAEFKANNVNANLGAIVVPCDGSVTTCKIYGTPCAPLKMQKADEVDTSEAHRQEIELKSSSRTYPVGIIAKSLVPATDNAEINAFLGLPVSGT